MEENVIEIKSFDFAVRTVDLYKYLTETKHEYVMARQLLRCGTSIGEMWQKQKKVKAKQILMLK